MPLPSAGPLHRRAPPPPLLRRDPSLILRKRTTLSRHPTPFSLLPPISYSKPSQAGGECTHRDGAPPRSPARVPVPARWPGPGSSGKGVCARAAGAEPTPQEVRRGWCPHTSSHQLPDENRGRDVPQREEPTSSPPFSPSLFAQSLSLSVLSLSIPPLPLCLPFSHLRHLEHPAFSRSPARTPQRSAPRGPGSRHPARPLPCPALLAPGLTQKSRLKPRSRYLMHRRPPRKRPMLRPRRRDPESPGPRPSAGSSGSRPGGGGARGARGGACGAGRSLRGAGREPGGRPERVQRTPQRPGWRGVRRRRGADPAARRGTSSLFPGTRRCLLPSRCRATRPASAQVRMVIRASTRKESPLGTRDPLN